MSAMLAGLALPAGSSGHAEPLPPGRCLDYDEGGVVRYTCRAPATVAFCIFSYTMRPGASGTEKRLARDLACRPSQLLYDPCYLGGPGTCDHAKAQARVRAIASMDVVWRVCGGTGDVPRYEGRGEFGCAAWQRPADTLDETRAPADGPVGGGDGVGVSKDDVLEAQAVLAALGYDPGPADGRWGPRTGSAVQSLLGDTGLAIADLLTVQAIRAVREASSGRDAAARALQGIGSAQNRCEGVGDGARRGGRGTFGCTATARGGRSASPERRALDGEAESGPAAGDVLEAQQVLARLGFDPGPADGRWGPRTGRALQTFLREAGLSLAQVLTVQALQAVRGAASPGHAGDSPAPAQPSRAVPSGAPAPGVAQPRCADMRRPSGCWMEFENLAGCHMWLENVGPEVTVLAAAWYGRCSGGKASGPGSRLIRARFHIDDASFGREALERGSFVAGRAHGRWISLDDESGLRTRTDYVDGEVQRIEVRDTATGGCIVSNFDRGTFLNSHDC